jgi:cytochrome P450
LELISVIVDWDRGLAAADALREYFANIVAERRRQPGNDLISELLETEYDGVRLSDDDVFAFLRLLLPAGVETTYRALGNLLFALLAHPDQLQEVVETPELRNAAIEEALRWQTPLVVIPRRTTRAVRLGGVSIPRDSVLNVFLGSANRDERRYENPDDFDIHRVPTPHISFGTGPHMCLGMHLARLEMRVALDATLSRLERLRFDRDAPIPHIVGIVLRSPDALPVRYARTV